MSYKVNNKATYTSDGIPYLWNSGDVTTTPSNEVKITASDAAAENRFGYKVAVGFNRIVSTAYLDDENGSDSGSAYIFDLDGNQLIKITPSDATISNIFGWSLAIGCGRIIVGAIGNNNRGAAYIFDLDGNEISKIVASDGAINDNFGTDVAIGCGRIIVGATNTDNVNGNDSGSAYIFDLDGNEIAKIIASDGAASDNFGRSVAVGCGRIVVGMPGDDDFGTSSGSAYIFDLNGNQVAKIVSSDIAANDSFGGSAAVGSGRIIVGAPGDGDAGTSSGSAYVFDLDGNELEKITASDAAAGDQFGFSVAIGSGRILVGAYGNDDNGSNSGSAYVFDLDGNELSKIVASDAAGSDVFGSSVAVGSGRIVVGAYRSSDAGSNSGSAYIYNTPKVYNLYDAIDQKENL